MTFAKMVQLHRSDKGRKEPTTKQQEDSIGVSVCKHHISSTKWPIFTQLLLPAGKRGQQQGGLIICTENFQLCHPFLAK
jgi:hypothetical protein